MKRYNYIILGGGAIGMAIAYRLADTVKKSRIALIDYHTGGSGSRAAGAMLGCFGEVTKYTFSHKAYQEKFDLMYAAHNIWPDWMRELENVSREKIWHTQGTDIILNTQGGVLDEENFDAIITTLKKYKEPFEEISPRSIEGLDAFALAKPLRAIHIQEGAIESNHYLKVLKIACEKKGVQFIDGKVSKIVNSKNQFILEGDFDKAFSENVIVATGAFTDTLLKNSNLGVDIMPMFAGAGFAMVTQAKGKIFKNTIRVANRSSSCGLHLIPYSNKREYIGATNVIYATPQYEANTGMLVFLIQCVIDQVRRDIFLSKVEEYRIGNRPISLDTFPLIGKTSLDGLFMATGTYRDGFHCSPIIAQDIVNEIVGDKKIISNTFKPERKPIQTLTQEESVKDYALQNLSGAYEFSLKLPGIIEEKDILSMYEQKAKDLYRQLQIDVGLNTDILFCLSTPTLPEGTITELKNYLQR